MAVVDPIKSLDPLGRDVLDHTGKQYHDVFVVSFAGRDSCGQILWNCRCKCGTEFVRRAQSLKLLKSCGCLKVITGPAVGKEHSTTHGKTKTVEYKTWIGILARCNNPNDQHFPQYGGRGITVCERWRKSFTSFLADMGTRPSDKHSIDRYPDNDGNYEPGNCRWATRSEQQRNKSVNRWLELNGETLTLAEWSERTGLPQNTILNRLKRNLPIERVLSPQRERVRRRTNSRMGLAG
jgi:hypothetical protein